MILNTEGAAQQQPKIKLKQPDKYIKQPIFWIYQFFILLITIILMVYSIKIKKYLESFKQTNQFKHALQTISFWKLGFIIDIATVSTINCPQGYQPLINHNWSGTIPGCACYFNLDTYQELIILKGKCDMDLLDNGCTQIFSIDPEEMSFWKGEKLLCIKRIKSLNFYNSTFASSNICSNNTDYEISNYLNVSCPITNISNISLGSNSNIKYLDSNNNNSLYYLTNGGYPIVDFKISQYAFCPFFNTSNISPNKSSGNYILNNQKIVNCQGTDQRIQIFDSIDEASFYYNNQNIMKIINTLPGYPKPSNKYIYYLGYVTYPEWSYICRISDIFNLHIATSHLLLEQQKNTTQRVFYVTTIFSFFFSIFFRTFYIVKKIKQIRMIKVFDKHQQQQQQQQIKNSYLNNTKNFTNQIIIIFLDVGTRGALFIILVLAVIDYKNYSIWFNQSSNCTAQYLNQIVSVYFNTITKIYNYIISLLVLVIILILSDILYVIFRCLKGDLTTKIKQKQNKIPIKPSDSYKNVLFTEQREKFLDEKKLAVYNLENIQQQQDNNKKKIDKLGQTKAIFDQNNIEDDTIMLKRRVKKLLKKKVRIQEIPFQEI